MEICSGGTMTFQDPVVCPHGNINCNRCGTVSLDGKIVGYTEGTNIAAVSTPNGDGRAFEMGTDTSGWTFGPGTVVGGAGGVGGSGFVTGVQIGPNAQTTPLTQFSDPFAPGAALGPPGCNEHALDPETFYVEDGQAIGYCEDCGVRMIVPSVPGGVSFASAGALIGKAMSLDDEDSVGDVLAELNLLEATVKNEIAKYKRTLGLVKIARDIAHNKALEDAKMPIG
jgi:hypothetical protein